MTVLTEIRAAMAQGEAPDLADLLYTLRGENTDLAFTFAEVLGLVKSNIQESIPYINFMSADTTAKAGDHGGYFMLFADNLTLTLHEDTGTGWMILVGNPDGRPNTITLPAGGTGPATIGAGIHIIARGPDDVSDPENPVAQFDTLPLWTPHKQAAFVQNADPTSLATLAASVDALRDSLVNSEQMASA